MKFVGTLAESLYRLKAENDKTMKVKSELDKMNDEDLVRLNVPIECKPTDVILRRADFTECPICKKNFSTKSDPFSSIMNHAWSNQRKCWRQMHPSLQELYNVKDPNAYIVVNKLENLKHDLPEPMDVLIRRKLESRPNVVGRPVLKKARVVGNPSVPDGGITASASSTEKSILPAPEAPNFQPPKTELSDYLLLTLDPKFVFPATAGEELNPGVWTDETNDAYDMGENPILKVTYDTIVQGQKDVLTTTQKSDQVTFFQIHLLLRMIKTTKML